MPTASTSTAADPRAKQLKKYRTRADNALAKAQDGSDPRKTFYQWMDLYKLNEGIAQFIEDRIAREPFEGGADK